MADQGFYISLHNGESALPFSPFFILNTPSFSNGRCLTSPTRGSPTLLGLISMPPPTFLFTRATQNFRFSATPILLIGFSRTEMDNHQMNGLSFDATDTMKLNVTPTFRNYASNGQIIVPQPSPLTSISRPSVHFASEINVNNRSPVNIEQSPATTIQFEDKPSWIDDLLDEPETPVNKSIHRRSRSDSVTYLDTDCRTKSSYYKELLQNSAYGNPISPADQQHGLWNSSFDPSTSANDHKMQKNDIVSKISGLSLSQQEQNSAFPMAGDMQNLRESGNKNVGSSDLGDEIWHNNSAANSESKAADVKRAKQHNARRSRVRKVQYIADLERSVQVLHAEGSLVSAELEFLDHQNLILSMENRALRQRLESLSQVQVIKSCEYGVPLLPF
ncbi:hypothetical protein V2J09_001541 [Rumex salicifolius]